MALRTLRQRVRAFNAAEPDARDLEAYVPEALADGEVANLAIADRNSWTLTSVATDVESLHGQVVRSIRPTSLTSRAVSPETAPGLGDITAALFCAWIKPVQLPAGAGTRIIHLGRDANENFSASIGSTAAGLWRGQTRATAGSNVNSATTMQVGRWDHVAFYFSNGGRMELSVNGLFPSISASAQSMANAVPTSFIIGAPADGAPDSLRAHVADAQWFVFDQTMDFDGWRPIAETSYCQGLRFYNPLPSRTYFLPSAPVITLQPQPVTIGSALAAASLTIIPQLAPETVTLGTVLEPASISEIGEPQNLATGTTLDSVTLQIEVADELNAAQLQSGTLIDPVAVQIEQAEPQALTAGTTLASTTLDIQPETVVQPQPLTAGTQLDPASTAFEATDPDTNTTGTTLASVSLFVEGTAVQAYDIQVAAVDRDLEVSAVDREFVISRSGRKEFLT